MNEVFDGLKHARPGISSAEMNNAYSVLINYVTARMDDFAELPVRTDWVHSGFSDSAHALRIQVCDFDRTDKFVLHLDVNEDIFGEQQQAWLIEQFSAVIDAFIEDPYRPIGSFDLLTDAQRQLFVHDFNATACDLTEAASVVELFEAQVARTPDATAVIDQGTSTSYAELSARASRLANLLYSRGVGIGDRVAICLGRSTEFLVAVLGTLKAGASFTPIDPVNPAKRKKALLDDLEPAILIADEESLGGLSEDSLHIRIVDPGSGDLDAYASDNPAIARSGDDIAYFIYTSGSTGTPKAAMLSHAGLLNYVAWAANAYMPEGPLDFPLYSSIAFDLTLTSIFVPLIAGGTIRVYPEDPEAPGLEILEVFADDAVDIVKLTPAHLDLLRDHGAACRRIGKLILGGEDLKTNSVRSFLDTVKPDIEVYNEYGPTEATVGCMIHRFDADSDNQGSVPIGVPAANVRIHIWDRYDQPVPFGVTGEMVISGPGVALGYWKRDDLTEQSFGTSTATGDRTYRTGDLARWGEHGLQFLGRADEQVKVRGARIELGEIENTILEYPGISTAAAVVQRPVAASFSNLRHCLSCGLPSNYPNADIDVDGICADCRDYARLKDEVDRYFGRPDQLRSLIGSVRAGGKSNKYDCIVLVSGGKDSTYMLYQLVREFGVRPLAFTLDNGYLSDRAISNVREACDDLGIDLEVASTPHMDEIFADSLRRHCNVCNGCFKTIYTLSMSLARRMGISTIITGLSRGQMFETRLADTFRARQFDPDKIDRLIVDARKFYHRTSDAVYELLDHELFSDERIFDEIRFIDFYRYVDVGLDELYAYLRENTVWERPKDTGRSTNCRINDVGIYVHKKMRGYHNYALPYSWDVRLGHKKRAAAMEELDDSIDEGNVVQMLEDIGCDDLRGDEAAASGKLAAFFVSEEDLDPKVVREFLLERLPAFMVPGSLVQLDSLPLTNNGKIDRRKLPGIEQHRPQLESEYVAPSTPLQTQLHAIWSDVIGLPRIGINDDFFELGGDSVMSIRIAAQAQALGLRMNPRELFLAPTIASLADAMLAKTESRHANTATILDSLEPDLAADLERLRKKVGDDAFAEFDDVYPLTPVQEGMLYHATASPMSGVYVGQVTCKLSGQIDLAKLAQAWCETVADNAVLRTRFFWEQLDRPLQAVTKTIQSLCQEFDWRERQDADLETEIGALRQELAAEGFDLAAGTPVRFTLIQTDDNRATLIWDVHHILLDGWSAYPILDEWLARYRALLEHRRPLIPAARPFRDYVSWQAGQSRAAHDVFWGGYLKGLGETSPISLRSHQPAHSAGFERMDIELSKELSSRLDNLARKLRVTLNTVFHSAWAILVSRYSNSEDVVFGSIVSGRSIELPGIEFMKGIFLNTLPVRLAVSPGSRVAEWLPEVQGNLLEIRQHEDSPLADIHRAAGLPANQELFDTILVFENYETLLGKDNDPVRVAELSIDAPSHYPLALLVFPDDPLRCRVIFDSSRFSATDVEQIAECLKSTLASFASDSEQTIGSIDTWSRLPQSAVTKQTLLSETDARPLVETITEMCLEQGDSIALTCGEQRLSYGELLERSEAVTSQLRALGVAANDRVAIEASRSIDTVVAMLGVWKSGAAFVPVDPDYPAERIEAILSDAGAAAIVSAPSSTIDVPGGIERVRPDRRNGLTARHDTRAVAPGDLAYVLYTSGSTGKPKGVMVSHHNIALSTAARPVYYGSRVKRFLSLPSFAFDSSLAGLFWTLRDGGEVLLPDPGRHDDLVHLSSLITRREVSHVLTLPSFYELLLESAGDEGYPSLEVAIVAGESCPPRTHARHLQVCEQAELFNEYGPTEGTVWSHVYHFPREFDQPVVPIGKPVGHIHHRVLDRHQHTVPVGVPGELYLGGPGIALGYINDEDRTAEHFVDLPQDDKDAAVERFYRTGDMVRSLDSGDLEFLGRTDEQLKIRGFRVEPAEIEAALCSLPDVSGAVVAKAATAGERLVAWYTARSTIEAEMLRRSILNVLPPFMLPDAFVHCDAFPRLPNGKVDRRALLVMTLDDGIGKVRYQAPGNDTQQILVAIWMEKLEVDRIGIDDNFFDLGGDSLKAMRIAARAHRQGLIIAPADLMKHPTIRELSMHVGEDSATPSTRDSHPPQRFELAGLNEDEMTDLLDELER
jgi:amino acid adenylation domain-containing protein